jgi:hypothetical protein
VLTVPTTSCVLPLQTAKAEGGPADLLADRDVESSDTNPAMDPSEQSKVAGREGSETAETQAMSSESGQSSLQAPCLMCDNRQRVKLSDVKGLAMH